ncbi:DUF3540 domain-containing protein [Pseudomonas chlororaphis]|uniref:DUF3540 domain-containing protein n=1 Tax=Pseudomonas chlororaphis TaxID=587753 RepID=UPI001E5C1CAB|nr:DUF3540 domain-containing protein [Pseudomonas chlororaphis]
MQVPARGDGLAQGQVLVVDVQAGADGLLQVEGMPAYTLVLATSCLVQPLAGDRVHGVVDGRQLVITAILSRRQADTLMTLDSGSAPLHIVAPHIEIHGRQRLALHSADFSLLTRSSRWVADTLNQVSRRLFVRCEHASRKVAYTDQVQARHIAQDAQQSFVMNSEIASLKSSAVLKIDGGQVHVG